MEELITVVAVKPFEATTAQSFLDGNVKGEDAAEAHFASLVREAYPECTKEELSSFVSARLFQRNGAIIEIIYNTLRR